MDLHVFATFLFNFQFIRSFAIFHCAFLTGNVTTATTTITNDCIIPTHVSTHSHMRWLFRHIAYTPPLSYAAKNCFEILLAWKIDFQQNSTGRDTNEITCHRSQWNWNCNYQYGHMVAFHSRVYMYVWVCVLQLHIVAGRFLFPLSLLVCRKFEICSQLSIQLLYSIFN